MIILCDFDGTVIPKLLEIGTTDFDTGAKIVLKKLVEAGHKIVLWTCRNDEPDNPYNYINGEKRNPSSLQEAIDWFNNNGVPLYGINSFPGEKDAGTGSSRKLLGDIIIDDTAIGTPTTSDCVNYRTPDGKIHCKRLVHVDWKELDKIFKNKGFYD